MTKLMQTCSAVALVVVVAGAANAHAGSRPVTLAVTMTNDPMSNEIKVYDVDHDILVQTLSTGGQGGVSGNARGVKQYAGELFAAVNNGSNTVALFRRDGDRLKFDKLITTTSAPVSIDFGNGHMYVAGVTTVDSFVIGRHSVEWMDGTAVLELAGGGPPPSGSTAQVGVISDRRLLVTLKTDPDPGTVDVIPLRNGAVSGTVAAAVSAPANTLTPFGFAVYPDGTAVMTLAHSSQDGLFRNGAFTAIIYAGQVAPCWMTRTGKYVFTANTGSGTISRLIGTGTSVFVDSPVAASITTGGAPSDIDADQHVLGVIDHAGGASHLSLFTYNRFGELTPGGAPIDLGVANANGVAIMAVPDDQDGH
jgi:hypothetical protein